MTESTLVNESQRLADLDHAHVWHPFTPMRQWRQSLPLVIERGEGAYLIDTEGRRFIDGVSSLWCNLHGHRVEAIDQAIHDQIDLIAHSTLLGLASPPSIKLASMLVDRVPGAVNAATTMRPLTGGPLNKVFYTDAGATALEVAFKMAAGYWFNRGEPEKNRFIALAGAYHGDTVGAMSVGYSGLFHRPFKSMTFPVQNFPTPDPCRPPFAWPVSKSSFDLWPSEDEQLGEALMVDCIRELEQLLDQQSNQTAAIVLEPVMQGAAGMVAQPTGFVRAVAELAQRFEVLLIADEVATGFGRTGAMFACSHDQVQPDLLCLAKGLTAGYLPLAATLATDSIESSFAGEVSERLTLYHGHTYTGNALGCAAAVASLDLIDSTRLLDHIVEQAELMRQRLRPLRACPNVLDVRQRGLMVGIELCQDRHSAEPLDFAKRTGAAICMKMRDEGLIVRPLGDVIVLMPVPAMSSSTLDCMLDVVVQTILNWDFC